MRPNSHSSSWNLIIDDFYYLNAKLYENRYWLPPSYFIKYILDGKKRNIHNLIKILWELDSDRLTRLIIDINNDDGIIQKDVILKRIHNMPGCYQIADGHHRVVSAIALDIQIPIIILNRKGNDSL